MSTLEIVQKGLQKRYPTLDLAAQFEEFIDDVEFDSELIQEDITIPTNDDILSHLSSQNPSLNKSELNKSLIDILTNPPNVINPHSPHPTYDQSDSHSAEESPEIVHFDDVSDEEQILNNAEEHTQNPMGLQPPTMLQSATSATMSPAPAPIRNPQSQFEKYLYALDKSETETVKKLLLKYCPMLLKSCSSNDRAEDMIFLHSICHNTQQTYFSWIMDMFDRFKIDYIQRDIDALYFAQICPAFGTYLEQLSDKNGIDFNRVIPFAMHEYNTKILQGLDFKPKYKISDNYYGFVSNICGINSVMHKLVSEDQIYPLQFDIWIIPNKTVSAYDFQPFEEEKQCGDIEETLLEVDFDEENYDFEERDYLDECNNKPYVFNMNDHQKMKQWIEECFCDNFKEMEQNKRYVLMIDRRECVGEDKHEYNGYTLICINDENVSEYSYFDEQYFERSKKFMFVTEDEHSLDWSLYENNAQIFGLSYHIINKESVKVYWNVGNKKSRFRMRDMFDIWPLYFDERMNDLSMVSEVKQSVCNDGNMDLTDLAFNQFYECMTHMTDKTEIIIQDQWVINSVPNAESLDEKEPNEIKNSIEIEEEILSDNKETSVLSSHMSSQMSNVYNSSVIPHSESSSNIEYEKGNYNNENEFKMEEKCESETDTSMTAMLAWLKQKEFSQKYAMHHRAFKQALKEGFDENDFEMDDIIEELGDINESEIYLLMKEDPQCNEQELNVYINALTVSLKEFANMDTGTEMLEVEREIIENLKVKRLRSEVKQESIVSAAVIENDEQKCENDNDSDNGHVFGGGGNTQKLYKVFDKHFVFYCCGNCGNQFAKYIFNDINKDRKLEILSNYFWSFDYDLRQKLIEILTEYYDNTQAQSIQNLLCELNKRNVFIGTDTKWLSLFERVLHSNNGDLLLKLTQFTCMKRANNVMKELRDNNINICVKDLQKNIREIRLKHMYLSCDEIMVLYIVANDSKFKVLSNIQSMNERLMRDCKWKAFHFNLHSAIHKLKKYRYSQEIPKELYCFASNISNNKELNLYLNQITVWHGSNDEMQKYKPQSVVYLEKVKMSKDLNIIPMGSVGSVFGNDNSNGLYLVLPLRIVNISCVGKPRYVSENVLQYSIPSEAKYKSMDII